MTLTDTFVIAELGARCERQMVLQSRACCVEDCELAGSSAELAEVSSTLAFAIAEGRA